MGIFDSKVPPTRETTTAEKWDAVEKLIDFIADLPEKGKVDEVYVGGSLARGEARPLSDVDIYLPTVTYATNGLLEILFERDKILREIGVFLDIRTGEPSDYGDEGCLMNWQTKQCEFGAVLGEHFF